jgi:RNA polymerase sigma factor (sigma-70 family)
MPMTIRLGGEAIGELRTLLHWGTIGSWTDSELLSEFVAGNDGSEPALRVLIDRHGPVVLGVCRRVLGDEDAAEDAFQATFLVLVRKAGTLRDSNQFGNWLYGVALRVARKERAKMMRRRTVERQASHARPRHAGDDVEREELRSVVDEEVGRLPERYRIPLVLCYMQGLRHEEVARRLGCPVGTVESWLSRGREKLRARLTRRGLSPSLLGFAPVLRSPSPSAALAERTLEAAATLPLRQIGSFAATAYQLGFPIATPSLRLGAATLVMVISSGLATIGLLSSRAGDKPEAVQEALLAGSQAQVSREDEPRKSAVDPPAQEPKVAPLREAPSPPQPELTKENLEPTRASYVYAPPLTGIVVDGQLDDWPAAIPRHPIDKLLDPDPTAALGHGGLRGANLWTSPDLSAAFSVGYDPKEQLLYLAVTVRDDQLVVGHSSHLDTDAVEVYLDGLLSNRRLPLPDGEDAYYALDPTSVPAQQYVAIPGKGMIYGRRQASNPILIHGTAKDTRTRTAFTRKGDVTIYEWAIQVFDEYPKKPARLEPGKRIGFDIAIADKDVPASTPGGYNDPRGDRSAWIYWGPSWRGVKTLNAGTLGELILVK